MRTDFYQEYSRIELEHWWAIARRKIILTVLERFVPLCVTDTQALTDDYPLVLDVGIGSGAMLGHLKAFGKVVGCDRERAAFVSMEYRRGNGKLSEGSGTPHSVILPPYCLVQAEAEHLPFKSEVFDLITLFDLLEHTKNDDAVLGDVGRVLKSNGFLCITVPAHRWLWGNQDLISCHIRRYQHGELERKIETAGLSIIYRTYFNTILFPLVALIRWSRRCRQRVGMSSGSLDPSRVSSDFSMTRPGRLNDALTWIFSQEARWIRRWSFPMGVSLLCLAQKPAD